MQFKLIQGRTASAPMACQTSPNNGVLARQANQGLATVYLGRCTDRPRSLQHSLNLIEQIRPWTTLCLRQSFTQRTEWHRASAFHTVPTCRHVVCQRRGSLYWTKVTHCSFTALWLFLDAYSTALPSSQSLSLFHHTRLPPLIILTKGLWAASSRLLLARNFFILLPNPMALARMADYPSISRRSRH